METVSIDRFEGDFAVCEREDCSVTHIEISCLPKGVRAGNILRIFDNGDIKIDVEAELLRKKQILKMQDSLFDDEE